MQFDFSKEMLFLKYVSFIPDMWHQHWMIFKAFILGWVIIWNVFFLHKWIFSVWTKPDMVDRVMQIVARAKLEGKIKDAVLQSVIDTQSEVHLEILRNWGCSMSPIQILFESISPYLSISLLISSFSFIIQLSVLSSCPLGFSHQLQPLALGF